MAVTTPTVPSGSSSPERLRRVIDDAPLPADRWFFRLTSWSGFFVLVLLVLVGVFLVVQARPAMEQTGIWEFLTRVEWRTDTTPKRIGVLGLLTGTLVVALVAVIIAIPLSIGVSLFITELASPRVRRWLVGVVDLMAAIPALLFGIWGFLFLSDQMLPVSEWLTNNLGFLPFFATDDGAQLSGSMFIASVVVALMVIPIITAVVREVFAQVPVGEKEAALALGATRLGMIRTVVMPYGRGGIVGGSMLGLGRALGETIAVVLLLPQVPEVSIKILQYGGATVSGFITNRAGSDDYTVSGLMAAGMVLFLITLGTNMVASVVVARSRSGQGVDL